VLDTVAGRQHALGGRRAAWRGRARVRGRPPWGRDDGTMGSSYYIMYGEIAFECVCVRERASGGLLFVARALVSLSSHTNTTTTTTAHKIYDYMLIIII